MAMKRKVLKVGNASLAVSLPSKWVKEHNLKAGDELDVEEKFDHLILGSKSVQNGEEVSVTVTEGTISHLRSIISNAYKKGYDSILLNYEQPETLNKAKRIVSELIGFEIVDQGPRSCTIKNIARELETEDATFLKKSFYMTLSMAEIGLEDAKRGKVDRIEEMQSLKEGVTKYTNFVKRITNKHKRTERSTMFLYLTVWSLEKAANEYLYIYQYLSTQSKRELDKKTIEFFIKTNEILRVFFTGFYDKNHKVIRDVGSAKDKYLYEDIGKYFDVKSPQSAVVTHHLANIVRRTYDMTGPYFGINL